MGKKLDTRLSYSSSTLLSNCSMKYYHYKVAKTPRDPDAKQEMVHFNVGKAFHQALENTMHKEVDILMQVTKCCEQYAVPEFQAMIHAMVLKYLKVHGATGLECVGCEMELSNDIFIGFVDAVMVDEAKKEFWIVDLKTAAFVTDLTFAKLTADTQLNLYSSFAKQISDYYNLDGYTFAGSRYRTTKKSKLKQRKTETYNEYVLRIYKGIESYDAVIPASIMDPEGFYKKHTSMHDKANRLRSGEETPVVNHSYCDAFFKPCEYFSQCHGDKTFTESVDSIQVHSWESLK